MQNERRELRKYGSLVEDQVRFDPTVGEEQGPLQLWQPRHNQHPQNSMRPQPLRPPTRCRQLPSGTLPDRKHVRKGDVVNIARADRQLGATRRPWSTSFVRPAWRHPTSHRSRTTTGRSGEQSEWRRSVQHRAPHVVRRARRCRVATPCQRPPGHLARPCRPTLRSLWTVLLELCSLRPPPFQKLRPRWHWVDDGHALVVFDDANLQRFTGTGRPDEHRDRLVVGVKCSPVMSNCVEHVIVVDAMLSG